MNEVLEILKPIAQMIGIGTPILKEAIKSLVDWHNSLSNQIILMKCFSDSLIAEEEGLLKRVTLFKNKIEVPANNHEPEILKNGGLKNIGAIVVFCEPGDYKENYDWADKAKQQKDFILSIFEKVANKGTPIILYSRNNQGIRCYNDLNQMAKEASNSKSIRYSTCNQPGRLISDLFATLSTGYVD